MTAPAAGEVYDVGLARTADRLAADHHRDPADPGRCGAGTCHRRWPCTSARFATYAGKAARAGRRQAHTARHDLVGAGIHLAG